MDKENIRLSGRCKSHKFSFVLILFSRTAFKSLFVNIMPSRKTLLPNILLSLILTARLNNFKDSFENTILKTVAQAWRCHLIGSLTIQEQNVCDTVWFFHLLFGYYYLRLEGSCQQAWYWALESLGNFYRYVHVSSGNGSGHVKYWSLFCKPNKFPLIWDH